MTANAFDTLKAAKSLKAAGFDEAQAEAVVAAVGDAVREHTAPLASGTAAIADTMATKKDVATVADSVATISNTMATKDELATVADTVATVAGRVTTIAGTMATKNELATVADRVATIAGTMATKEHVAAAIAVEMKTLYRYLWLMGTSIIGITVALNKLLS